MKGILKNALTLLAVAVLTFAKLNAQSKLDFGVNAIFDNSAFYKMVNDTISYQQLFRDYNIEYLRFPAGDPARFFIYDNPGLTLQAREFIKSYFKDRNPDKDFAPYSFTFSPDYYTKFLQFCKNNQVQPLIQLNTCFYEDNGQLHQVAPFQQQTNLSLITNGGEKKITTFLTKQIQLTHTIFQNVTWEIGNEDYYTYKADTYANIVKLYTTVIHSLYPNDKIIVSMANQWGKNFKAEWNKNFISDLVQANLLKDIDYFAPHFYINTAKQISDASDLTDMIDQLKFDDFEKLHAANFPAGYTPKFFYTEFAIFLQPLKNSTYDTNIHALLFFYYLMNFYSSNILHGIIYHSFTGPSPLIYTNPSDQYKKQKFIDRVPVQASAEQLFFRNVGNQVIKFSDDKQVCILVTKSNNNEICFVLNLSADNINVDGKLLRQASSDNYTFAKSYSFSNLNSKGTQLLSADKNSNNYNASFSLDKYSLLILKQNRIN